MTLNSTTTKVSYDGDGATVSFPVTFKFLQNSHVTAILRDVNGVETTWVEGTHYTLTGAGEANGGTLTVNTVPTDYTPLTGETLLIKRSAPETQGTTLPQGGTFSSTLVETALDQLTMLVQQHSEEIARAVLLKETSAKGGITIPDPETAKFIRWDALAQNLENADVTGSGSIGVPVSIAQGGTNATTASAARTNLGLAIGTNVNAFMATISQAEAEAGIATDRRAWTAQRVAQAIVALESGLPRSYGTGLVMSNNATDPTNDLDFTAGAWRDDADGNDFRYANTLTRALDATFVAGGPGFRDSADNLTGAKWFHIFAIGGSGKTNDLFASTSLTPTLPTGFAYKRRIGSRYWDGSALKLFTQFGDLVLWKDPPLDVDVTTLSTSRVLYGLTTPLGTRTEAIFNAFTNDNTVKIYISSPLANDEVPSASAAPLYNLGVINTGALENGADTVAMLRILTDTNSQIAVRANEALSPESFRVATLGFVDRRGRDD